MIMYINVYCWQYIKSRAPYAIIILLNKTKYSLAIQTQRDLGVRQVKLITQDYLYLPSFTLVTWE